MTDEQKKKKVRGAGKCEKLYKRRREGHPPIELEWERGEPVRGPYVLEFTGLVGFEARSRVPITHNNWHDVPKDLKAMDIYVIPPNGVRHVMTVAGSRHRTFRTFLRGAYLMEGGDHYGEAPFDLYTCIEPEHWEEFQIQMGTPEAKATTSADIACSSTETVSQLGREDSWLMRGHTPVRHAEVTDPAPLMEIRDRIVQLKKEVAAGTFVPDGHNDVLTRALGTAKHPRWTRGVGSYSGLRKVFKGNMKPRKPEGNYMTQEDLLQRLPSLLQQEVRLSCAYYSGPVQEPLGSNGFSSGGLCMSTIGTGSVSSVDSSRTFMLGKRRKNKRKSYDSKECYQRAHRKARIAKLRIWKRRKAAWERDDPEETFSVDSANSICGAGGDNPPVDSA
ncbi:unnamed protein product [Cuscuta campestris]|uniref:Uncharacterized protein n=1 Tax=Cuscuta campestris TaxID=132261 RepID=A0A484K5U7_9ASTE|nr:unnamed protein product [Cuscuta campestris]